jgi:hypothetical protein
MDSGSASVGLVGATAAILSEPVSMTVSLSTRSVGASRKMHACNRGPVFDCGQSGHSRLLTAPQNPSCGRAFTSTLKPALIPQGAGRRFLGLSGPHISTTRSPGPLTFASLFPHRRWSGGAGRWASLPAAATPSGNVFRLFSTAADSGEPGGAGTEGRAGEAASEVGGGESAELSQDGGVKKKSKNRGRKRRGIIDDADDEKVGVSRSVLQEG